MSTQYANGKIVNDGLVVALNAADRNSYVSGSTVWNDVSINAYSGSLSGVSAPTYTTTYGGSINFSGGAFGNSYVANSNIPDSFWNAESWSVSTWIKFNVVNTGGTNDNSIVGHGASSANNGLHLAERGGKVHFGLYNNDLGGTKTLIANTIYNIIWTFDFTTKLKQIYLNSVFDISGGVAGYTGTGTNTRIGGYPYSNFGLSLNGNIYNIQFYSKVLSQQEIIQNYNAQKTRFGI